MNCESILEILTMRRKEMKIGNMVRTQGCKVRQVMTSDLVTVMTSDRFSVLHSRTWVRVPRDGVRKCFLMMPLDQVTRTKYQPGWVRYKRGASGTHVFTDLSPQPGILNSSSGGGKVAGRAGPRDYQSKTGYLASHTCLLALSTGSTSTGARPVTEG